jgi:hypothetical protein
MPISIYNGPRPDHITWEWWDGAGAPSAVTGSDIRSDRACDRACDGTEASKAVRADTMISMGFVYQ